MNPKFPRRVLLALTSSALLVASSAQAAIYYWDGNDTTANADGGVGNWDNLLTNWDTLAAAGANSAWSAGSIAVFTVAAAPATVTLTDNITVGGLTFNGRNTFNANSYTLNAATNSKTLSFSSGDNTILFNNGNGVPNATITGQVAGTGANVIVRLANPVYTSTLTFNGASTGGWTGVTTIGAGMTLTSDSTGGVNQVLNNTSAININGGTLRFNRSGTTNTNIINDSAAITVNGGGTLFQQNLDAGNANAIETVGAVTINSGQFNFNINNGGSSGSIVRLGNLTTNGTSAVTFSFNAATNNFWENLNGGIAPANTAANEIIGAWATTGAAGGVAAQTDYAIYTNSNGRIAARNIAASAQSTWSTTHAATSNYTLANASGSAANGLLSATRNINTLRYTTAATAVTATNATDVINLAAHGFVAGDVVSLGGTTAPTGLTLGQVYYVINATANTFQLSTTSGGGAALFTADGTAVNIAGGVTLPSGTTLGTFGILNGSTATLAIGGNGGNITLPTTAAGNLFVTTGSGAISIAAPITDNGAGVLTLVKNGSGGALTLSGNNTFTGGLVVNAGTLRLSGTQSFTGGVTLDGGSFGDSTDGIVGTEINSNSVTVNGNANMFITSGATIAGAVAINSTGNLILNGDTATLSGVVSGSGGLTIYSRTGTTVTLTNTANTHTGVITIAGDNNTVNTLAVNSLADSASLGAGNIQLGGASADGNGSFALHSGAIAALTLNNRQFDLQGDRNQGAASTKLSNNSTQAFTINSNLLASGTNIRTLTLGGSGAGLSTFGGTITNGSLTTLNITKVDANNIWSLTNAANSYNGVTTVTAGTLRFSSIANAGSNSSLGNFATAGATGISLGGGTLQYVGASGVSVDRGVTLTATSTIDVNPAATSLTLGASSMAASTLNVTGGSNGSSLGLGATALTGAVTLNPTGADLTVASISSAAAQNLTLGGTTAGNSVGAISTLTGTLTKNTASTWTLTGTNGYTGTTTVSAGLLRVNGSLNASSAVTVSAGAIGGTGTVNGSLSLTTNGGINLANGSVGGTAFTVGGTLLSSGAAGGTNNMIFDLASGGTTTDQIVASGAFNMTNAGAVVVSVNQLGGSGGSNRLTAGTYDILTAVSGTALSAANGGNFRLATTMAFGQTFSLSSSTSTALKLTTTQVTANALAANTTISNASASWATAANFTNTVLPDYQSNVTINSAIGTSPLNGSTNINSLTYGTSATTATTISAGTATAGTVASMLVLEASGGTGITVSPTTSVGHVISANIGLASNQTWNIAGTGVTGTFLAPIAAVNALTISGVVSDFGAGYGITKTGTGLLSFQPATSITYTGTTTINGGGVMFNAAVPSGNITISSGVYEQYFGGFTARPFGTGLGQMQITGGVSGFSNQGGTGSTFSFTGTGTSPIVWGSTYFNPTEFILQSQYANANSGNSSFSNNIDLNGSNRTIRSDQNNSTFGGGGTFSGNISNSTGTAGLIKTGIGLHYFTGVNTYNGGTTISEGTLQFSTLTSMPATGAVSVSSGATLGIAVASSGTTWGGGASNAGIAGLVNSGLGGQAGSTVSFAGNSSLLLNVTGNTTESNNIGNGGATNLALIKIGASTLTLSGNNSYSGGTTLRAGALAIGHNSALGTGTFNIVGGTIQSNDATTRTLTNAVTIGGDFTVGGIGNLTFSNTGASALGATRTITVTTSTVNATFAQAFSGAGFGITKAGAGTLTLTGNNSFTGATTISAGTLVLNNDGDVTSSAVTFNGSNSGLTITGGSGVTSIWNNNNSVFGGALGGSQNNVQVRIDGAGTAGSARLTNVTTLNWGASNGGMPNSTITLTNGGQMNVSGEIRFGSTYYVTGGGANMTIGGVSDTAISTFTGNSGQAFYIGHGDREGVNNNVVTVNSNGVLTSIGNMFLGQVNNAQGAGGVATANRLTVTGTGTASMVSVTVGYAQAGDAQGSSNANVVEVTAGGTLTTSGVNYIGRIDNNTAGATSNGNTMTVTGTGSSWGAGNQNVLVGFTNASANAASSNNILTVSSGGSVTGINGLTLGSGSGTETGNKLVLNGGSLTATIVTVNASNTLEFGTSGGTLNGNIVNNGAMNIGSNVAVSLAGNISGTTGTITQTGSGTTTLSGTNSFTGTTVVNAGTLQFAKMVSLNNNVDTNWTAAKINVKSAATLALNVDSAGTNGFTDVKLNTLLGNISVANTATEGLQAGATLGFDTSTATGGTFTQGNAIADSTGSGSFHGAIGLTKLGTGTLVLDKTNTYTGATTITTGTLALSGTGSIASSTLIKNNSTLDVTGLTGNFTIGATQTFGGTGTIIATGKTVIANGTLSPGNSPGTVTQNGGTLQLGANANYNWQIVDGDVLATAGLGYDTVDLTNGATLDLSALSSGTRYNINLWSLSAISNDVNGDANSFNNTLNHAWTLFSTGTAITGFDASLFNINVAANNGTTGFTNALGSGTFSLGLSGDSTDLMLNFTAIPEPSVALLGGLSLLGLVLRRRRRD